jgi:hypothetical protein
MVLYMPMLMLIFFVIVQLALSWYGNEVAGSVAREALRVARTGGGSVQAISDAQTSGVAYATQIGGGGLNDVQVTVVTVGTDNLRATVTGRSQEIVAGLAPQVRASVEGPVEQFRGDPR